MCATFGTGVGSACVVDIGDQKTSVSCIEDGLSQPATRLVMHYGGSDITRCFHWLLARCGFPYQECRLSNRMDALFLQELKESYCHLEQVWICGLSRIVLFVTFSYHYFSTFCFLNSGFQLSHNELFVYFIMFSITVLLFHFLSFLFYLECLHFILGQVLD